MRPDIPGDIETLVAYVERQAFKSLSARDDVVARIRDGDKRQINDWCAEIMSRTPGSGGYSVVCAALRVHSDEPEEPASPAELAAARRLRMGLYHVTGQALHLLLEVYGKEVTYEA
jgi:hypothetical protein